MACYGPSYYFLGFYTWAYFPGCAASSSDVLRVITVISNSALGCVIAARLFWDVLTDK
jgi:hypothetical protein